MSPSQRFVINSEQSRLAKRHRRNVFKAKLLARFKAAGHLALVIAGAVIGLALTGFGGK